MNRFMVPALALALVAAPTLLEAQGRGFGAALQNPIQAILNAADSLQLDLTAEQQSRLEQIRTDVDAENAQRLAQIQEALGGGAPDPGTIMPIVQGIFRANQAAIETARLVLGPEQLAAVDLFLESLAPAGRGRGRGARGGGPPG